MSAATETSAELQRAFMASTKPRTLADIVDALVGIMCDVDGAEGEVTPDQETQLDALQLTLEQKVEGYAAAYAQLNAEAEACKEIAQRYAAKSKQREASADRLRTRLYLEMQRLGRDVIKTPTASARIQASPDKLELEDGDDAALLAKYHVPDEYIVTTRKIDRRAVLAALKVGLELPFAWITKSSHLRFR